MAEDIQGLNSAIRTCTKCSLSVSRTHALPGEGDLNSRLMLVAQAPGENEDREGRMFIGPSGKVLDDFLSRAEVDRNDIYMTNLIKCVLPRNRQPKQSEIEACSGYLDREIELVDPEVIAPMGYYATRYVLERYETPLPESKAEMAEVYGRLLFSEDVKIYPLPHPASVLFDKSRMEETAEKYLKLRVLLAPCKWFPFCPLKRYRERDLIDSSWVQLYCRGDWESCKRYELEESGVPHPDWMLPDGTMDESLQR